MSFGIVFMSPRELVQARCHSTVSALILSKEFRQTGIFPQNTNPKRLNLPTMWLSLLFVLLLCQLGQIESWIYTNQMLKCFYYVINFFVVGNVTLMLLVCAVALACPRSHFSDVQPTDADYSLWLMVRVGQPSITSWTESCLRLLICSLLFWFILTEFNFTSVIDFCFVDLFFTLRGAKVSFCSL